MIKRLVQNLLHKELSYSLHGAAIEVRKDFGPGHKEKLYQKAFAEELNRREISFEREKAIKVFSPKDGEYIGLYRPDFIIDKKIIVEMKAEKFVSRDEIKRIYDYLRNSEYELAYFINFASPLLFVKRIIYTNDRKKFNPLINTNIKLMATKKLLVFIGFILVAISGLWSEAEAATVFLTPAMGEYSLGDTFGVEVRVDTQGEAINAVEANIVFSPDLLEVVGLEKENSILTLWIGDPAYLNAEGFISFAGGLPNPGYQGKDGLIGAITFKAKSEGKAEVSFKENSNRVLLNDGFGTKALLKTEGALYALSPIKKKLSIYFILSFVLAFLAFVIWGVRTYVRRKH